MKTTKLPFHFFFARHSRLILATAGLLAFSTSLFAQSWLWGAAGYGSLKSNDFGSPIATDKNGNVYITGFYQTTVTFGSHTLTGNLDNAYLVKYDSSGNVIWAVKPNDTLGYSSGISLATDKTGNIYITGYISGIVKFGGFTLTTPGNNNNTAILVKYTSSGSVVWAKQATVNSVYGYSEGYSLAFDKWGNIFMTGYFSDSVSFGGDTLYSPYVSSNTNSVFLAKFDTAGNVLWVKQAVVDSTSAGRGQGVACDNLGNPYITGYFYNDITFGSYLLSSSGGYNFSSPTVFIAKYSGAGNVMWAKQGSSYSQGRSVTTDEENNAYITGYFEGVVSFDSKQVYTSNSWGSSFLTKYNSNSKVLWAKQTSGAWVSTSLTADKRNHIYLTGQGWVYTDTLQFGQYLLYTYPWVAATSFLLELDTSGTPICGSMIDGLGDYPYSSEGVASDSLGKYVYMAGVFTNDTIKTAHDTLISKNGGRDIFTGRWLSCCSPVNLGLTYQSTDSVCSKAAIIKLLGTPAGGALSGKGVQGNYFYPDSANLGHYNYISYTYPAKGVCRATITDSLYVEICTGIPGLSQGGVSIYPNPTTGKFAIRLVGTQNPDSYRDVSSIEVYNVFGEKVYSTPTLLPQSGGGVSFSYEINLSSQPNGIYFYRVLKEDGGLIGEGKMIIER